MAEKEFEEFKRKFGKIFSKNEMEEIKNSFGSDCRNSYILGVTDRKYRGKGAREEIVKWLNEHPDEFAKEYTKRTGKTFDVRDAVI